MQAIILAAGKGTRMKSQLPKVLHSALGRPLLGHVLSTLKQVNVLKPRVIVGNEAEQVSSFLKESQKDLRVSAIPILQKLQRGTGHAVMMAEKSLGRITDDVLIWPGDMPLLKVATLKEFIRMHRTSRSDVSVLSSLQANPKGYGRILRAGGGFYAIREELDATETEKRIQEVNTGVYLFKAKSLFAALKRIRPANKKKELYLTDVIEVFGKKDLKTSAFPLASDEEGKGINDRKDLAAAIEIMKNRENEQHMEQGVTIVSPEQTFIEKGAKIGMDTIVYPWSYIESGVKIGKGCSIGPFAKIRKGTVVEDEAAIGSFVEVARSKIGKKVLAKHLAYIGDAVIGDGTNIGAGVITANFDGKSKNKTKIGNNVLIGSNTVFVAPNTLGDNVRTGAGSVITRGSKIKKGGVVAGVPAKPLKTKRKK